jgi:hypothetical protein
MERGSRRRAMNAWMDDIEVVRLGFEALVEGDKQLGEVDHNVHLQLQLVSTKRVGVMAEVGSGRWTKTDELEQGAYLQCVSE